MPGMYWYGVPFKKFIRVGYWYYASLAMLNVGPKNPIGDRDNTSNVHYLVFPPSSPMRTSHDELQHSVQLFNFHRLCNHCS
jgi:hypothetical protein